MATVSLSSIAVSTRQKGFDFEKTRDITRQGDAGWGVSNTDRFLKLERKRGR